jgi:amino acid adenylation domain-containing protein
VTPGSDGATLAVPAGPAAIVAALEAHADAGADRPALTFGGETVSYGTLVRRVRDVASALAALGVGPETTVAVCLRRSPELVVALAGVLGAGGTYLPLDPDAPAERSRFMARDGGARLVVTDDGGGAAFPGIPTRTILELEAADGAEPRAPRPLDVAYVIYTSGSTGLPKGVANTHAGLANRLEWMRRLLVLDASDVFLQKTAATFDVSVWEFFLPLALGARLIVAAPGGQMDPAYLADAIEDEGVTIAHFVPSMLRLFLEEPNLERRCRSLRHVVCSGEVLPPRTAELARTRLGARVFNLYGPTEAAVDVTWWECGEDDARRPTIPIGRAVANTALHVLDARGEPAAEGESGELFIEGVQVARGYVARPGLTAARFLPSPYGEPGARMYATGDVASVREGVIEYHGRRDNQIKLRGFRIELEEIEANLLAHPAVAAAAVAAFETAGGNVRLVAFVVGESVDRAGVRSFLGARLPEYMIPTVVVLLETLPTTPSGKVDRRSLPAPHGWRPWPA